MGLTGVKGYQSDDLTTVLHPQDYYKVKKPTFVRYSRARIAFESGLRDAVNSGAIIFFDQDIDSSVLNRIKRGLFVSPYVEKHIKEHFEKTIRDCPRTPCTCAL